MKLSKTQRRIAVCKDALLQIKLDKYKVKQKVYVELINSLSNEKSNIPFTDIDKDAKECILSTEKTINKPYCEACAKGAIFVSLVRKENNVKLSELENHSVREDVSNALFDKKNLDLIEATFENWPYFSKREDCYSSYNELYSFQLIPNIRKYYKRYPRAKERLIAILKNMVRNKGVFKLPK